MKDLIIRLFTKQQRTLIGFSIASILLTTMFVVIYPAFKDESEQVAQLLDTYPEGFMEAFGISKDTFFDSLESTIAGYYFGLLWQVMMMGYVMILASGAIAHAVDRKHITFLLSQPLSRTEYLVANIVNGVLNITIFNIVSVFAAIPLAILFDVDYVFESYLVAFVVVMLYSLCIYALALMVSSIHSASSKVYIYTSIVLLITYSLNLVANLVSDLDGLKYVSNWFYFDYNSAFINQELYMPGVLLFTVLTIVFTAMSFMSFEKRDVHI